MADDPEAERPEEDQEGGPVKTFLEHLEDLRWVFIKTVVALGVAMLVCLIAGNYVVGVIKWPLDQAKVRYPGTNQVVTVRFGTNWSKVFQLTPEQQRSFDLGTNRFTVVSVEPVLLGTNRVLGWRAEYDPVAAEQAQRLHIDLINLSPAGGFFVAFQVAFYGGMVMAAPLIFYWVASFVFPALKMRERKYVYRGLGFGAGLFFTGVIFCYFVLMPVALAASQMYSQWLGLGASQWKAEDYISFVCKFMLGMGLGFELPVVLLTLVKIGVLSYATLRKMWRYMIVINLFLGAVLTTPEVITQVLMAAPLYILYEISVWIAWYWDQPDRAKARRRLAVIIGAVVLLGLLVWLGGKYGGPWLRQLWQ
ncbi:MAG: twin-arginine translocase subunit TatC [Verrucomicrobia bacterium]|nr:twin-arginine translocase subunit TatC [Verrucomicrobiota bacterium]